ncbi:hypothetical protein LSH36_457g00022 [Paralvinella palmiformis]|uniref:G-protein coupled receptors family 1 profile domain-containing protein n=1 Tax=Paralvinella palmiformis TaxID=53620 RepID=A0AAD9JAR3_9ANNE|nr:hypothetical protein LSH36_457g00022 [Paralvinella palmiformis]
MGLLVLISWSIPFVVTLIREKPANVTLCELYYLECSITYPLDVGLVILDSLVMIIVYSYILDQVRRRSTNQCSTGSTYRTTVTSFWIVSTFIVFYWSDFITNYIDFPLSIYNIIKSLPLVNCIVDPLIYAIRINEIRAGLSKSKNLEF